MSFGRQSSDGLSGRDAAQLFSRAGISTSYVLVSGMAPFLRSASKCFFGASSVASNGAVLGRAGQGLVAAVAKQLGVPTIVFSESYKRSDSPRLNSLSWNELCKFSHTLGRIRC